MWKEIIHRTDFSLLTFVKKKKGMLFINNTYVIEQVV